MKRKGVWVPDFPIFNDEIDNKLEIWKTHTNPEVAKRSLEKIPDIRQEFVSGVKEVKLRQYGMHIVYRAGLGAIMVAAIPNFFLDSWSPQATMVGGIAGAALLGGAAALDARHARDMHGTLMRWREERLQAVESVLNNVISPPKLDDGRMD